MIITFPHTLETHSKYFQNSKGCIAGFFTNQALGLKIWFGVIWKYSEIFESIQNYPAFGKEAFFRFGFSMFFFGGGHFALFMNIG